MINIHILTLFPDMFSGPFNESIISRALGAGIASLHIHNLRDWADDKRKTVDDRPFGGGAGMILKVEPIEKAVAEIKREIQGECAVILLAANGEQYTQKTAEELTTYENLILICGHYEGVDERVNEHIADRSISIGEYVLTGGELPSMVIVDSIIRLLPGVLGNTASLREESREGYSEYPQYTQPREYKGWEVPDILFTGDHEKIAKWRNEKSIDKRKK